MDNAEIIRHIVQELLESSSSDDDEIHELLRHCKNEIPKIDNYISNVVNNYSDEEFKSTFRISRQVCKIIIDDFKETKFYKNEKHCGGRMQLPPDSYVLAFIWFATNNCCVREVSEKFGMGQTSCHRHIAKVMDYLVAEAPKHIKFPVGKKEKETAAQEFHKISGFPGILGCIGGTYVKIRTPAHRMRAKFVNKHDIPAITLQGICDSNSKFIDVFVGPTGKVHQSKVYQLSCISKDLPTFCDKDFHIIGDNTYELSECLLTPYKDNELLTEYQRIYNFKFYQSKILIENAFGLLKGRFRQLCNLDFHTIEKITKFIVSCCVLHNLCIDNNDFIEPQLENLDDENDALLDEEYEQNESDIGEIKRNELCAILNNFKYS